MSAIDHVGFQVSDYATALTFYTAVLKPLGWKKVMEFNDGGYQGVGFGPDMPVFWLSKGEKMSPRLHLAFSARSRAAVDAFYEAAMKAGARDNGPPGVRKEYHPNYYAAFVIDPEGHNIEAVIHVPPAAAAKKPAKKAAKAAKADAKASKKAGKAAKKAARKGAKKAGKKKRK